jgi:hypothetical protein
MALPRAPDARSYYQAAKQRFEDACFLLEADRTTGAIYLAGYCVEGMLKALILSVIPARKAPDVLRSFRGPKAHDYDWLKKRYFGFGGPPLPTAVAKAFTFVNTWAVTIRYEAGAARFRDAERFLDSTKEIMDWADGRI